MKCVLFLSIVVLAGCATVDKHSYNPVSPQETAAFTRADRSLGPGDVSRDFEALKDAELAWAGVIKAVKFKENGDNVFVAFRVEHRHFDWSGKPYLLSSEGDGEFMSGQSLTKSDNIEFLRATMLPGSMLIVYGKPLRVSESGMIQLSASSIRPVLLSEFSVEDESMAEDKVDVVETVAVEESGGTPEVKPERGRNDMPQKTEEATAVGSKSENSSEVDIALQLSAALDLIDTP
jgi:hypothetical protein